MFFTATEVDDVPVSRRGRSSGLKRRGIRENSEERLSKNIIRYHITCQPNTITVLNTTLCTINYVSQRVEDIEAGVESPIEVATEEHLDDTFSVKESETVLRV